MHYTVLMVLLSLGYEITAVELLFWVWVGGDGAAGEEAPIQSLHCLLSSYDMAYIEL